MRADSKKQEKKLREVLRFLENKYAVAPKEVLKLIREKEKKEKEEESEYIPVSLFTAAPVSSLEVITLYLRDVKKLKFSAMGSLLGRNQIALSSTYRNAKKKYPASLRVEESEYKIPCAVLKTRSLSVLETIVVYLKNAYMLQNNEIAKLLGKDPRTIWTVLKRAKKKEVRT